MICVSRKARNATFRNYVAAETATPVITCCAVLGNDDQKNFYFAGVCRSKSVRPIDDGVGPSVDEFFTLAIGGMLASALKLHTTSLNRSRCTHSSTCTCTCECSLFAGALCSTTAGRRSSREICSNVSAFEIWNMVRGSP